MGTCTQNCIIKENYIPDFPETMDVYASSGFNYAITFVNLASPYTV
jgi:hypothetical protein